MLKIFDNNLIQANNFVSKGEVLEERHAHFRSETKAICENNLQMFKTRGSILYKSCGSR